MIDEPDNMKTTKIENKMREVLFSNASKQRRRDIARNIDPQQIALDHKLMKVNRIQ